VASTARRRLFARGVAVDLSDYPIRRTAADTPISASRKLKIRNAGGSPAPLPVD
jgi:hypothetical protein